MNPIAQIAASVLGDAVGGSAASPGVISAQSNPNVTFGDFGTTTGTNDVLKLGVILVGVALVVRMATK